MFSLKYHATWCEEQGVAILECECGTRRGVSVTTPASSAKPCDCRVGTGLRLQPGRVALASKSEVSPCLRGALTGYLDVKWEGRSLDTLQCSICCYYCIVEECPTLESERQNPRPVLLNLGDLYRDNPPKTRQAPKPRRGLESMALLTGPPHLLSCRAYQSTSHPSNMGNAI